MFDLIVIFILGLSALVGWIRGAAREVATVVAFVLAVLIAVVSLRFSGPLFRAVVGPDWLASALALLVVFVGAYIVLRIGASMIGRRIKAAKTLGTLDRTLGVGFGLVRAIVLLGVLNLVLNVATPPERMPTWITEAYTYPLTSSAARALQALAPKGSALAGRVAPALGDAVKEGSSPRDKAGEDRYDAAGVKSEKKR